MKYTKLSNTDIKVSKVCLGTMSFGAHVDKEIAFEVMDRALELGINFFDTAELYAVPPCKETYGLTEKIIGNWIESRKSRNKIVLATKIVGPNRKGDDPYIRNGETRFNKKYIREALEDSLKRLKTDYIDLYQLHWPDRNVNKFGQRAWIFDNNEEVTEIKETIEVLNELINEGKIKHYGLSNETPWGVMKFLEISKQNNLARPVSIQNNYSLLTRSYENCLAEISIRENIGLLGYSPLGYGVLGGRYLNGNYPEVGRFTKYPKAISRYRNPSIEKIIKKYKNLAEENNMTIASISHAFAYSRDFMKCVIIGPSNVLQLEENVAALDIKLSQKILDEINKIQEERPNPCA